MINQISVYSDRDKLFVYMGAKSFGDWLRNRVKEIERTGGKMSNAEIARRAGLSPTYIGNLMRGDSNPSEDAARRIARAVSGDVNIALTAAGYATATGAGLPEWLDDYEGLSEQQRAVAKKQIQGIVAALAELPDIPGDVIIWNARFSEIARGFEALPENVKLNLEPFIVGIERTIKNQSQNSFVNLEENKFEQTDGEQQKNLRVTEGFK